MIKNFNFILLTLFILSMTCILPAMADVAPMPLSSVEAYINKKGRIIIPNEAQKKTYYYENYSNNIDLTEGLFPFQADGLWGYKDNNKNVIIEPQFRFVQPFSEGAAAVYKNDKWGYINKKGEWIISPKYPMIICHKINPNHYLQRTRKCRSSSQFKDGLAPISYDKEIKVAYYGVSSGKYLEPVFPDNQKNVSSKVYGYIKNDKFYIQKDAEENKNSKLKRGYITTLYKNGYIDKTGNVVIKGDFQDPMPFSEGLARVQNSSGLYGYIDKTGKYVIKPKYRSATPFKNGIARVEIPSKRIIIPFSIILLILISLVTISFKKDIKREKNDAL